MPPPDLSFDQQGIADRAVPQRPEDGDAHRPLLKMFNRIFSVRRAPVYVLLTAILATGAIHWKYTCDIALALELYRREAHDESRVQAERIGLTFMQMYQGLRTIARLPAVRQIGRHGESFDANGRATVQEIYNNLASNVALSEVYVVPADLDPELIDEVTGKPQEPIITFDELIVGRNAESQQNLGHDHASAVVPEIEIFEYRLMRRQANWFRENAAHERAVRGLNVPAISGPEVITCDNSRFKPSSPDDKDRSGIVYSVPVFGVDGAFHAMVSGIILTHAFSDLLPDQNHVVENTSTGFYITGQRKDRESKPGEGVRRERADRSLLYSEMLDIGVNDVAGTWRLWAGLPNESFWNRSDVLMIQRFMWCSHGLTMLLTVSFVVIFLREARHREATETVARSLLMAERTLHQQEKLASVGQLAAGVAHEINTPIQYVGDNLRALSDNFANLIVLEKEYRELVELVKSGGGTAAKIEAIEQAEQDNDLDYILEDTPKAIAQGLEGVGRVASIVRAMKDFSHVDRGEKTSVDINHCLQSTLTVARAEYKYVADVETQFGDLPQVECCASEMNQVFLNLLVNAAHAIGDTGKHGTITIRTCAIDEQVEIAIGDTGTGIPEAVRDKVFDPFFTTKEIGKGTGQGLSITHQIVVGKHGGTLTFETEMGKGTTFFIRLPTKVKQESETVV